MNQSTNDHHFSYKRQVIELQISRLNIKSNQDKLTDSEQLELVKAIIDKERIKKNETNTRL